MSLSRSQSTAIEITERLSSILSLLGTTFIITTFLLDNAFRKPINRLVFYAAWGNVVTNIATLIGVSGIHLGGGLCQFQAFIIQMFMPADALWTFAMACNVYLTFFHKYDAAKLRTLELTYLMSCYGLPFIPAFVYCFIQTAQKGRVYGSAVLWCWVSLEWDILRITTFYGPVWIVIIATFMIYLCAGVVVFKWRDQLVHLARNNIKPADTERDETQELEPVEKVPRLVLQKSDRSIWAISLDEAPGRSQEKLNTTSEKPVDSHHEHRGQSMAYIRDMPTSAQANRAAINYCKCAVLFFIALLVTWVPSTINRAYTLVHPDAVVFGLNYSSGLVLPLQGFWNTLVYVAISFPACKAIFSRITFGPHQFLNAASKVRVSVGRK